MKKDDPTTPEQWQNTRDSILLFFYNADVDPKYRGQSYWIEINNVLEALEKNAGWEMSFETVRTAIDYLVGHN